jgi:hypothetical protein
MLLIVMIAVGAVMAFADVAIEPAIQRTLVIRGGDPSASFTHISGLGQYPDRDFYIVETIKKGTVLVFTRITGDSVTVDEKSYSLKLGVKAGKFLSWDPILSSMKPGQEYKSKDVKLNLPDPDRQSIDYGRSQRQTIEIPVLDYIGFERVDNYYDIQWHDPDGAGFYSEFELEWRSQVWQHPQFLIRSVGEDAQWYNISSYLDDLTLELTEKYEFWEMQKQDLQQLLAYVPDLPGWELELLEPLDKVKVYYHKASSTSAQKYSVPIRIPFAYKLLAIGLSVLAAVLVFMLFYKVAVKGSRR